MVSRGSACEVSWIFYTINGISNSDAWLVFRPFALHVFRRSSRKSSALESALSRESYCGMGDNDLRLRETLCHAAMNLIYHERITHNNEMNILLVM